MGRNSLRRLRTFDREAKHLITLKTVTTMKQYLRPEFEIFEVAVEGGYGDSIALPGFGGESDELVY